MSNTTKADAATELMRGALRLNLSFLRDRFAGNDEAQAAIQALDTGLVALLLRFETALATSLADTTAERQAVSRAFREPPAGVALVLDYSDDARRHTFTVPPGHVAVRDSDGRATGRTVLADIDVIKNNRDPNTMAVFVGKRHVANFRNGSCGPFWYLHDLKGVPMRYVVSSSGSPLFVAETVRDMPSVVRSAISMGVDL